MASTSPPNSQPGPREQAVCAVALAAAVLGIGALVIAPFLSPLAWAVILGHAAWPLHRRVSVLAGGRPALGSLLTTSLVALALALPLLWALALLQDDLLRLYARGQVLLSSRTDELFDRLARIPWIGPALHDWLTAQAPPGASVGTLLGDWIRQGSALLLAAIGNLGKSVLKLAFTLLFLFFVFKDGEALSNRLRLVLSRWTGGGVDAYFQAAGDTNRAITLSVVLAALLQGVSATLGYAVVGLSAPIVLGFLTAVASILPMVGTSLVWGSLAAWLLATGHAWQALALAVWGLVLIHPVDNILRPWMVSNAARMPFAMALLGVLGGLATFGFVGVVLGPVILAVAAVLWKNAVRQAVDARQV
jgi:predicted PurR-regulated permease PerM